MTESISWESPSAHQSSRGQNDWTGIAAALRGRPGDWAKVFTGKRSTASNNAERIKTGVGAFKPQGAFEATTRGNGDGAVDLFARYVGHLS